MFCDTLVHHGFNLFYERVIFHFLISCLILLYPSAFLLEMCYFHRFWMASFCFCEDFTKAILYPYTMIYQAGILIYSYYHFTPECLHRSHINIGTKS